jgi:hypothetical protein
MKICIIKLGDFTEGLISVLTLGRGKDIATYVAKKIFKKDSCGCDERKAFLNKVMGCSPSSIKLDFYDTDTNESGNGRFDGFASKKGGHPLSKY